MNRTGKVCAAGWVFLLAGAFHAAAQPSINPPTATPPGIQSGLPTEGLATATLPAAITVNSNQPSGFVLIINGTFNPDTFEDVQWINPATTTTSSFSIAFVSNTQIQVTIPQFLFQSSGPLLAPQPITIQVDQADGSATGAFTLNPALLPPTNPTFASGATGTILFPGTVGLTYSQPMFQWGTGPYTVSVQSGSIPAALTLPSGSSTNLTGTPSTAGVSNWNVTITDAWGNSLNVNEATEIFGVPTIGSIFPNSAPAGSPPVPIALTGTNFALTANPPEGQIPASQAVILTTGQESGFLALATTVTSQTQLQATIPQSALLVPGVATLQILQPSNTTSTVGQTFTVLGPTITSVTPQTFTARTTPVTITVSGQNFVQNNSLSPTASTIVLNAAPAASTFVNSTTLTDSQVFAAGTYNVQVRNPGGISQSTAATLTVLPPPTITSLTPQFATAGTGPITLTVTGTNFTNTMTVFFAGTPLSTRFVNATTLTATIPANAITLVGGYYITVVTTDNYVTAAANFSVPSALVITTTSLPGATSGSSYTASVAAVGGTQPYTWSATGLNGLSLNPRTGAISGTVTATSNFIISFTVTDANGSTATANFTVQVTNPIPPVTVTTSNSLPIGTVGVPYSSAIGANGGTGSFTFSTDVGSLPPGLTISSGGGISGTPTTPGTFSFTIKATDSAGSVGTAGFSIVIKPAPLTVTGPSTIAPIAVGGAVSIQFGASGGVTPYAFNVTGTIPPGTTFSRTALLSGTATTAGSYTFNVLVTDSTSLQVSKSFTVVITPPQLTITGAMPSGQVGVAYTGTIGATGGQAPYTVTVSGLPDGLTYSNGNVTGTPTTVKTYTVSASVTDAAGTKATGTFTVAIIPPTLAIASATFGNGTVGVPYTATVTATGGVGPYTIAIGGLPPGVTPSSNGSVSGTPTTAGTYTVTVSITDSTPKTISGTYTVTIAPPGPLSITSATVPNTTIGSSVSVTFTATGGVPPYTWSATNLPGGLTLSPGGTLSGTVTSPGSGSFTVTVTDSSGSKANANVTVTVAVPTAPPISLNGLSPTSNPGSQSTLQIGIGSAYPVDVTVTLTLTFKPDSGSDDPTVQFASGGRTATVTIPAGSLASPTSVGVQTGTVAGTATITAKLVAAGVDITPSPVPTSTIRINGAVPVISSVTATISGNGFTVTVVGYDTTRAITQAIFTFTPASGANLQTTNVTVPVSSIFQAWYASSAATQYGSQFTFTQPFTVQGGVSSIASVSVVLVNSLGNSTAASATLH